MVFPSLHYARLDDPTYLAHRHQSGGALPPPVGPTFPSRAWGTLQSLFVRVLNGQVSPLIECEKGFIMPMSLREIGQIIDEAFPDLDNMYERMDIIDLRNFPDVPRDDGQWALVWRRG